MLFRFLAVVIGALLLAGCTSGGGAKPSRTPSAPTTSVSVSVSPSAPRTGPLTTGPGVRPGEAPPELLSAAQKHDASGALFFAAYFVRALDWSLATTDPYLLRQISAPTCEACQSYIQHIGDLQRVAGHVEGGRITLRSFRLQSGKGIIPADWIVKVETTQQRIVLHSPPASPTTVQAHDENVVSFIYVSWVDGHWRVEGDFGP